MQYVRPFPSLSATCDDIGGSRKAGSIQSLSIPQALNNSLHMQFLTLLHPGAEPQAMNCHGDRNILVVRSRRVSEENWHYWEWRNLENRGYGTKS